MKKLMMIVSVFLSFSSFAVAAPKKTADIQFVFNSAMTSLLQAYNNYETDKLEAFFELLSTNNGASLDREVLCVKASPNKNALREVLNLDNTLDAGPFEEVTVLANFSGDAAHPVTLTIHDDPNNWVVSSVNVSFCAY